jgi:hypothetical protein
MGFEFIHWDSITPQRVFAIVSLVKQFGVVKRRELMELLQPTTVLDNKDAGERNYWAAKRFGLLSETGDKDGVLQLAVPATAAESIDSFRLHMQQTLLGVTEDNKDYFLLNQFAAWYAVQGHFVFDYSKLDIEAKFNEQLYPNAESRVFRERSNFNAWKVWAEFLGWGWSATFGTRRDVQLIPDATMRLRPLLPAILPLPTAVRMATFMDNLRMACPELDGGLMFERCWQASRGSEIRGNRLSLMLSTALRVLDKAGDLELIQKKDADENWTLFPAQSYSGQITHIRTRKVA